MLKTAPFKLLTKNRDRKTLVAMLDLAGQWINISKAMHGSAI
jgi:hypothetical protein